MRKPRLSRNDWLLAGFRGLVAHGPAALQVQALARDLGTTKGSFYWHFKDLGDLHAALLDLWQTRALPPETETEPVAQAATVLRRLVQQAANHDDPALGVASVDAALRAWARSEPAAAAALARVDRARLDRLSELLTRCGVTNPELARALYASAIGMADLSARDGHDNDSALGTLVDLVLALR
jgi:AcrR family transcriptional regulator